jgi:hypothetical protein
VVLPTLVRVDGWFAIDLPTLFDGEISIPPTAVFLVIQMPDTTTPDIRRAVYNRYPGIIDEQMLSAREVAALFKVSRNEVAQACANGQLPCRVNHGQGRNGYCVRLADARALWGVR